MLGLYLHIPFCAARCTYCDFNTYTGLSHLQESYVSALKGEIALVGAALQSPAVETLFFGGGTPTELAPRLLVELLEACRSAFAVTEDPEITIEANPGSVDERGLQALRSAGVNRLSLGVQSFEDDVLRFLGRIHDAAASREAVRAARSAGFENLSLDLIYGLPALPLSAWRRTVEAALALEPDHLSLYGLMVEEGTPLARSIAIGSVPAPDDDAAAAQYEWTLDQLADSGFCHYEISNWARGDDGAAVPASAARHNLIYWRNRSYAGLGAGASSYLRSHRFANVKHPDSYIRALARGGAGWPAPSPATDPASIEPIHPRLAMAEQMILGLRLVREGVAAADFEERFGTSLDEAFGPALDDLHAQGLLERLPDRVRLTRRGYLLANEALIRFLP